MASSGEQPPQATSKVSPVIIRKHLMDPKALEASNHATENGPSPPKKNRSTQSSPPADFLQNKEEYVQLCNNLDRATQQYTQAENDLKLALQKERNTGAAKFQAQSDLNSYLHTTLLSLQASYKKKVDSVTTESRKTGREKDEMISNLTTENSNLKKKVEKMEDVIQAAGNLFSNAMK